MQVAERVLQQPRIDKAYPIWNVTFSNEVREAVHGSDRKKAKRNGQIIGEKGSPRKEWREKSDGKWYQSSELERVVHCLITRIYSC